MGTSAAFSLYFERMETVSRCCGCTLHRDRDGQDGQLQSFLLRRLAYHPLQSALKPHVRHTRHPLIFARFSELQRSQTTVFCDGAGFGG